MVLSKSDKTKLSNVKRQLDLLTGLRKSTYSDRHMPLYTEERKKQRIRFLKQRKDQLLRGYG